MPPSCPPLPEALRAPCSLCDGVHWRLDEKPAEEVSVFMASAVVKTTFPEYHCANPAGCTGRLSADGAEYFLLRKSSKWAIAWEVLYHWGDKISVGGEPWYTSWRDLIMKLKG